MRCFVLRGPPGRGAGRLSPRCGHMSAQHFSAEIFRPWVDRIPVQLGERLDDQGPRAVRADGNHHNCGRVCA